MHLRALPAILLRTLLLTVLPLPALASIALEKHRQVASKFRKLEDASPHPCGFERVNSAGLDEAALKKLLTSRETPLLVSGLDNLASLQADASKEQLLAKYGDHVVQVESGVDASRSNFKLAKHWMPLQRYVLESASKSEIVFELGLDGKFSQDVWRSKKDSLPPFLQNFSATPIVSVGTFATGVSMRRDKEAWLLSLQGRKAWWVSDVGLANSGDPKYFGGVSPCRHLEDALPAGFRFCVQQPGEIVFLPNMSWHATCNIDDVVWSIGAQGQTGKWPSLMRHVTKGNDTALKRELDFLHSRPWRFKHSRPVVAAALDRALSLGYNTTSEMLAKSAPEVLTWRSGIRNEPLDDRSMTSMMHAVVKAGNEHMMEDFILYGLSPLEPFSHTNSMSPFEAASMRGHTGIMELLAKAESDVKGFDGNVEFKSAAFNAAAAGHLPALKLLRRMGVDLRGPDSRKRWPLHGAAAGGQLATAKALAGKRALHVQAVDVDGNTPLHAAAEHGHVELIDFLLEHGAAVEVPNGSGMQPLHLAALNARGPVVERLLGQRADVHSTGQLGSTALHFASAAGDLGLVEFLLEQGASVSARETSNNMQPLHAAAQGGSKFVVDHLVESRADVHSVLADGQQALHVAASAGHAALVDFFISKALAKENHREKLLQVASQAAAAGHVRVLKLLRDKGVDLNSKGPEHISAFDVAIQRGHADVVKFFGLKVAKGQGGGEL